MKLKLILILMAMFLSVGAYSQIVDPITWSYAAKRTSANTATVYLKANIEKGWHLYSQTIKDGGPVKTSFTFLQPKGYTLIGKVMEPAPIKKYESLFKMEIAYFENSAIFQQKIKLTGKTAAVKGKVEFMVCNDEQCLPPSEVSFTVNVK